MWNTDSVVEETPKQSSCTKYKSEENQVARLTDNKWKQLEKTVYYTKRSAVVARGKWRCTIL